MSKEIKLVMYHYVRELERQALTRIYKSDWISLFLKSRWHV